MSKKCLPTHLLRSRLRKKEDFNTDLDLDYRRNDLH